MVVEITLIERVDEVVEWSLWAENSLGSVRDCNAGNGLLRDFLFLSIFILFFNLRNARLTLILFNFIPQLYQSYTAVNLPCRSQRDQKSSGQRWFTDAESCTSTRAYLIRTSETGLRSIGAGRSLLSCRDLLLRRGSRLLHQPPGLHGLPASRFTRVELEGFSADILRTQPVLFA